MNSKSSALTDLFLKPFFSSFLFPFSHFYHISIIFSWIGSSQQYLLSVYACILSVTMSFSQQTVCAVFDLDLKIFLTTSCLHNCLAFTSPVLQNNCWTLVVYNINLKTDKSSMATVKNRFSIPIGDIFLFKLKADHREAGMCENAMRSWFFCSSVFCNCIAFVVLTKHKDIC